MFIKVFTIGYLYAVVIVVLLLLRVYIIGSKTTHILHAVNLYAHDTKNYFKGLEYLHAVSDSPFLIFDLTKWTCKSLLPADVYSDLKEYL